MLSLGKIHISQPGGEGKGIRGSSSPSPASPARTRREEPLLALPGLSHSGRGRSLQSPLSCPSRRAPRAAQAAEAQLVLPGRRGKEMRAGVERKGIIHSESSCSACLAWDSRDSSSSSLEQNVFQQFGGFVFFFFEFSGCFQCDKSEDLRAGSDRGVRTSPAQVSLAACANPAGIWVSWRWSLQGKGPAKSQNRKPNVC